MGKTDIRRLTVLTVIALALSACAASEDSPGTSPATTDPATTDRATTGPTATDTAPGTPAETVSLPLLLAPTQALPAQVAEGEGFFAEVGIDAEVSVVEEDVPSFIAGQTDVTTIAAWEVAEFINEGEEMVIFGTAGQPAYFNGVAVLADSGYSEITDLVGTKLGIPGYGTGTWAAFEGFMASQFDIDAREDFEVVEASPGVLLGLLETGEIEGALLFSGQTLAAAGSGTFELIFRFDEEWEEITDQPLSVATLVARPEWLEQNSGVAAGLVDALSRAVQWMQENPQEFDVGGKYENAAADLGWHRDEATTRAVLDFLASGSYFQTQETYTSEYIESTYEFVEIVVEDPPARDAMFSDVLVSD